MSPKLLKPNKKKKPMYRFATGAKYRKVPTSSAAPELPRVGPFATQPITLVSSTSNVTMNSLLDLTSRTSPRIANTFSITPGGFELYPDTSNSDALFIWCNKYVHPLGSTIRANGADGEDPAITCGFSQGGPGGAGGSGGGGGAIAAACAGANGGNGGSALNGGDGGSADGCCGQGGPGGNGTAFANFAYAAGYAWPSGSDGSTSGGASAGGGGGGYGGGGAGGDAVGGCSLAAGSGGGGGGGLICIFGNEAVWDAGGGSVNVSGGQGGQNPYGFGEVGGNGGDGVIYLGFKKWNSAAAIAFVGNVSVFEINHAGTVLTLRTDYHSATWNNL
jgi:hypothetical protein